MSFTLPDLVIESIIRDGFENMKARPEVLDDLFGDLTKPYASRKYGAAEIQKIKDVLITGKNRNVAIVHSFNQTQANIPCISIQLGNDAEDQRIASMNDYQGVEETDLDEAALQAYIKIEDFEPTAYDPVTGKVSVPDSVNLSPVYNGFIYEDGSESEFPILSGISNTMGDKFFFIAPNQTVNLATGVIKSFINYESVEVKGVHSNVSILIGIHTNEALLTKYLYTLVKYFLLSRKSDMIKRCFIVSSFSGSDFTRDMRYDADAVYTRFLTVSGKVIESWRSDQVDLIDSIELDITVADHD